MKEKPVADGTSYTKKKVNNIQQDKHSHTAIYENSENSFVTMNKKMSMKKLCDKTWDLMTNFEKLGELNTKKIFYDLCLFLCFILYCS